MATPSGGWVRVGVNGASRPGRSGRLNCRAGSLSHPQERETTTGIVNDVSSEEHLGDGGFVEFDPGYLASITARRTYFAPLDQGIDNRRHDIGVESNQISASRGRKVDPPRHTR
jgi:hypothetical protein